MDKIPELLQKLAELSKQPANLGVFMLTIAILVLLYYNIITKIERYKMLAEVEKNRENAKYTKIVEYAEKVSELLSQSEKIIDNSNPEYQTKARHYIPIFRKVEEIKHLTIKNSLFITSEVSQEILRAAGNFLYSWNHLEEDDEINEADFIRLRYQFMNVEFTIDVGLRVAIGVITKYQSHFEYWKCIFSKYPDGVTAFCNQNRFSWRTRVYGKIIHFLF